VTHFLSFKNSNIKEFSFFFLLTAVLAILIKLSETYTTTIEIPIEITEVAIDKTIESRSPDQLEASISLSGFALLRNSIFKPVFEVAFSKFESLDNGTLEYQIKDPQVEMATVLKGQFQVKAITSDKINVSIENFFQKEVPVKSAIKFEYASGYNAIDSLRITPEQVTITGAASKVAAIDAVYTVSKTYDNVIESVSDQVALDTTNLEIRLRKEDFNVSIIQNVAKFTEGNFNVPIQILNDDINQVQIFPKNVNVFFNVSLEDYESISSEGFLVTCDFATIEKENNFLSLRLAKFPDKLRNVRLETKQVRFIIVDQ